MANSIPTLAYFQSFTREAIENDQEKIATLTKYKKIINSDWNLPDGMDLPYMRPMKTNAPIDGVDAAVRTLATVLPVIHVHAQAPTELEQQRATDIEDALLYHFNKANRRGVHRPLETITDSMLKYGIVACQPRYLPFDLKGQSGARIDALRRQGDFTYPIYDPICVHPQLSLYGLERVVVARVVKLSELISEYGKDNEIIQKIIAKITPGNGKIKDAEIEETELSYYDLTDFDYRVQWASLSVGSDVDPEGGGKDSFEFQRKLHKLPFLPFVYKECNKPLLETVVNSGAWEDQNVLKSLQFSLIIATAAQARTTAYTFTGKNGIEVDYTSPGGQSVAQVGEKLETNPPSQTDPNLARLVAEGEQGITQQMQTRALQAATDIASSAPFATFNAILQQAISSLSIQQQAIESTLEEIFTQELHWINASGIPLTGARMKSHKGSDFNMKLAQNAPVTIGPKTDVTFDPDSLDISVKLKPDSPTDEATRLNKAVTLKKELQFSTDDALEGAGMQSLDRSNQSYLDEQFSNALLQAKLQEILATSQLKIKQLEMQMQMQMQQMGQQQQQMAQQQQPNASGVIPQNQAQQTPQQANQDMNQGQAFNTAQGQAYNTGQGGASPYSAAPGMNREQINGQDQSGNPVGG
jgi:hypothetical protein